MSVSLINKNYSTQVCMFSFDIWDEDKDKLPNLNTRGKDTLSTIYSCAQGSKAIGTDGTNYILTGGNEWKKYSGISGGSSGGNTGDDPQYEDIEPITNGEIESLFK